ncbi:MAG: PilZ domain-containing protein, partial [Proteobacteria bacterium]|nr:PilZ domain-containing protein [Pseudomonadota bacterium]
MSKESASWDSIASLEELGVDWDFEPDNPQGKRAYARLNEKELCHLFQVASIPVKLVTETMHTKALLVDISQGGVSLRTKATNFKESQLVKIGFFLGQLKLISKGRIKNIRTNEGWIILGIEFVGLSEDNNNFL